MTSRHDNTLLSLSFIAAFKALLTARRKDPGPQGSHRSALRFKRHAPPPTPDDCNNSQGPLPGIASTDPDPQRCTPQLHSAIRYARQSVFPTPTDASLQLPKQADPRPLGLYDFDVASSDIVLVLPAPSSQDASLPPTLRRSDTACRVWVWLVLYYPKARVSDSPAGVRDGRFVEWHA